MPVPVRYNLRSLFYRKTATALTILAVALTVAVLVLLLAVGRGFHQAVVGTGSPENILVQRVGATSEGESTITRDESNIVKGFAGIATGKDGRPLVTGEMYAAVNLERNGGGSTNVTLRGTAPEALGIRDGVRVVEGRFFSPGAREVVIGKALLGSIEGCHVGGTVKITKDAWNVVGVIDGGGKAFDSEMWADVELVLQAFDRPFYNTVLFRKRPGADPAGLVARLGVVKVEDEAAYFARQAGIMGPMMSFAAILLTTLMSLGALAGCTNTLLAAVAGRTREIGGLLAIGYRPAHVFLGFLLEAMVICFCGGVLGVLGTLPINGIRTGTTNWATFTEQAFSFTVDAPVILTALGLALAIGLLGGSLPAWRAARLRPVTALRRG